jgi:hypothetical protein
MPANTHKMWQLSILFDTEPKTSRSGTSETVSQPLQQLLLH